MIKQVMSAGATSLLISMGSANAAAIDLLGSYNLVEVNPEFTGSGDVFYEEFVFTPGTLGTDFFSPLFLTGVVNSEVVLTYDFSGGFSNFVQITGGPLFETEDFDVVDFGFTNNTLEFLLSATTDRLVTGLTEDAILRVSSTSFDFSATDPATFFSSRLDPGSFVFDEVFSTTITVGSLQVIPLPASLPLFLAGLGAFGFLLNRRKSV